LRLLRILTEVSCKVSWSVVWAWCGSMVSIALRWMLSFDRFQPLHRHRIGLTITSPKHSMTTALTETMQASAQARQVLEELDEAAKLAQEAVEAVAPHSGARNADAAEPAPAQASEADRIRLFIQRAARQRNQGREEMKRQYAATMVVERELKIFDPHIASSVTRFLALTDKTLYLLGRIGGQYMTEAQIDKVRTSIQERVTEYANEGRHSLDAAAELNRKGRDSRPMWIEPHYTGAALDENFQVKSRLTLALVDAAKHWDEAIRLMCEMEFNACASESQIGEMRIRERRQFAGLNRLCASVVMGMSRRSHAGTARRSTSGANGLEGEGSTADGSFDAADTSQKENPDSATT